MKKVLLTAAAALAVFGSASVLADNGKIYVQRPIYGQPNEKGERPVIGYEKIETVESGRENIKHNDTTVVTDGPNSKQIGVWETDNTKAATIANAMEADDLRLQANSLEKTAKANAKKAGVTAAAKTLPNTGAVK